MDEGSTEKEYDNAVVLLGQQVNLEELPGLVRSLDIRLELCLVLVLFCFGSSWVEKISIDLITVISS